MRFNARVCFQSVLQCSYNFFVIREIKKKLGWSYQDVSKRQHLVITQAVPEDKLLEKSRLGNNSRWAVWEWSCRDALETLE